MRALRQNNSTYVIVGPFIDKTDGITPLLGLTYSDTTMSAVKHSDIGPLSASEIILTDLGGDHEFSSIGGGYYSVKLLSGDTNTLGRIEFILNNASTLTVWNDYMVTTDNFYNSMYGPNTLISEGGPVTSAAITNTLFYTQALLDRSLLNQYELPFNIGASGLIFINNNMGDDLNDGLTHQTPIKTLSAFANIVNNNLKNVIDSEGYVALCRSNSAQPFHEYNINFNHNTAIIGVADASWELDTGTSIEWLLPSGISGITHMLCFSGSNIPKIGLIRGFKLGIENVIADPSSFISLIIGNPDTSLFINNNRFAMQDSAASGTWILSANGVRSLQFDGNFIQDFYGGIIKLVDGQGTYEITNNNISTPQGGDAINNSLFYFVNSLNVLSENNSFMFANYQTTNVHCLDGTTNSVIGPNSFDGDAFWRNVEFINLTSLLEATNEIYYLTSESQLRNNLSLQKMNIIRQYDLPFTSIDKIYYVDPVNGNENFTGEDEQYPIQTLSGALDRAANLSNHTHGCIIFVNGLLTEVLSSTRDNLAIIGGNTWDENSSAAVQWSNVYATSPLMNIQHNNNSIIGFYIVYNSASPTPAFQCSLVSQPDSGSPWNRGRVGTRIENCMFEGYANYNSDIGAGMGFNAFSGTAAFKNCRFNNNVWLSLGYESRMYNCMFTEYIGYVSSAHPLLTIRGRGVIVDNLSFNNPWIYSNAYASAGNITGIYIQASSGNTGKPYAFISNLVYTSAALDNFIPIVDPYNCATVWDAYENSQTISTISNGLTGLAENIAEAVISSVSATLAPDIVSGLSATIIEHGDVYWSKIVGIPIEQYNALLE